MARRRAAAAAAVTRAVPLLLLLVLLVGSTHTRAQEVLTVDFGLIPADASSSATTVPRGCTCQSSQATCTEFECTCVCDLTAGSCDANCCCDAECSAAEVARFRAADACLAEGPLPTTTTYCADLTKEALFGSINPTFRMVKTKEDSVVDDLMCVAVDNNPSLGSYFPDPGTGSTALLASTTKPPSFQTTTRSTTVSTATVYGVGDDVGGGNGACFDSNTVKFATDVAEASCVRVLSGTSAERCTSLDMADFVTNLRVAKAPNSATSDATGYVSVTTASVQYRYINGTVAAHPTGVYTTSLSGTTCTNAVYHVAYTVVEDGAGNVASASATVVLGEADVAGTFSTLSQTWSVTWSSSASVTTSYDLGNLLARDMSGNPGYITGKPVLAGTKVTDAASSKEAIQAWVKGLGLKQCDGSTLEYVPYGTSMTFGCKLTMTEAELETMCTSKSQLSKFGTDAEYVGSFGNADPLRTGDWVQIVKEDSSALSTVWQSSSRSCSGVASGIQVEFLTAQVGEEDNAQDKILVAQVSYARDTWTYTSRASTQTFVIASSVSFVPKDTTEAEEYIPPPPPVLPELPNDLFYPFTLGIDKDEVSAAPSIHGTATLFAAVCVALTALATLLQE